HPREDIAEPAAGRTAGVTGEGGAATRGASLRTSRLAGPPRSSVAADPPGSDVGHQPEAGVSGAAIGRGLGASRDPVAVAVAGVAQVGAALHDPRRRSVATGAQLVRSAVRASGAAATTAALAVFVSGAGDAPAIRAPLPGVARHVVKTEAVGEEGVDRARARETVLARVVAGEGPLPHVAAVLAIRCQLVAPREGVLLEA